MGNPVVNLNYIKNVFLVLLVFATIVYLPNSGGAGLLLPYNVVVLVWAGAVIFTIAVVQK